MYTNIPSVLRLQPPAPHHPTPLSHHRAPIWAPCAIQQLPISYLFYSSVYIGLPRWHSGKESTRHCRRCKSSGFDPWVRKIPWRKKWQPTSILAWKIPWTEATIHGVTKESDMTEQLNTNMHSVYIIPVSQFILLSCPLFPTLHVHTFVATHLSLFLPCTVYNSQDLATT